MLYHILGKEIEIHKMEKPAGGYGSIFEVFGNDTLKDIGLDNKFYYCATNGGRFSLRLPERSLNMNYELNEVQNHSQYLLSIFLRKSIFNGRLTNQYEEPHFL